MNEDENDESTLKPCPFCGGSVDLLLSKDLQRWYAECENMACLLNCNRYGYVHPEILIDDFNCRPLEDRKE